METRNAKIDSTFLGIEDHGILTYFLYLKWQGAGQGFGGIHCGGEFLSSSLTRLFETLGIASWEDLPGVYVRIRHTHDRVHAVGHIIDDRWYDLAEHAQEFKES